MNGLKRLLEATSRMIVSTGVLVSFPAWAAPTSFGTQFPVYAELDLGAEARGRLEQLYRTDRTFAAILTEFHAVFAKDYAEARAGCGANLAGDVRLRTARQILTVLSHQRRHAPLPTWLMLHFGKLQQIACCLPDDVTSSQVERILRAWTDELERGGVPVDLPRHFANAGRLRPLFEFAMELRRTARPVWDFSDFYPPK